MSTVKMDPSIGPDSSITNSNDINTRSGMGQTPDVEFAAASNTKPLSALNINLENPQVTGPGSAKSNWHASSGGVSAPTHPNSLGAGSNSGPDLAQSQNPIERLKAQLAADPETRITAKMLFELIQEMNKDSTDQAAGQEYEELRALIEKISGNLSGDAKTIWAKYTAVAQEQRSNNRAGIPADKYEDLMDELDFIAQSSRDSQPGTIKHNDPARAPRFPADPDGIGTPIDPGYAVGGIGGHPDDGHAVKGNPSIEDPGHDGQWRKEWDQIVNPDGTIKKPYEKNPERPGLHRFTQEVRISDQPNTLELSQPTQTENKQDNSIDQVNELAKKLKSLGDQITLKQIGIERVEITVTSDGKEQALLVTKSGKYIPVSADTMKMLNDAIEKASRVREKAQQELAAGRLPDDGREAKQAGLSVPEFRAARLMANFVSIAQNLHGIDKPENTKNSGISVDGQRLTETELDSHLKALRALGLAISPNLTPQKLSIMVGRSKSDNSVFLVFPVKNGEKQENIVVQPTKENLLRLKEATLEAQKAFDEAKEQQDSGKLFDRAENTAAESLGLSVPEYRAWKVVRSAISRIAAEQGKKN